MYFRNVHMRLSVVNISPDVDNDEYYIIFFALNE